MDLSLSAESPSAAIEAVSTGRVDLALLAVRRGATLRGAFAEGLVVRPCAELPVSLVVPPSAALPPGPLDITQLTDRPWIVPRPSPYVASLYEVVTDMFRTAALDQPELRFVSSMQVGLPLIAAGLGVGLAPVTEFYATRGIVEFHDPRVPIESLDIAVVHRETTQGNLPLENFLEGIPHRETVREA